MSSYIKWAVNDLMVQKTVLKSHNNWPSKKLHSQTGSYINFFAVAVATSSFALHQKGFAALSVETQKSQMLLYPQSVARGSGIQDIHPYHTRSEY